MEGGECDVVTGVQVRDCEISLLILEGLADGAISRLWTQLPRHPSQGSWLKERERERERERENYYRALSLSLPQTQVW